MTSGERRGRKTGSRRNRLRTFVNTTGRRQSSSMRDDDPNVLPPSAARSRIMASVRQKGTAPELRVRAALTRLGLRYRLNVRGLPGSPDVANVARRFVVLINGCYWHRHRGCSKATTPTRNRAFWVDKFEANQARDARTLVALKRLGFSVCIVWECETRNEGALLKLLTKRLRSVLANLSSEEPEFSGGQRTTQPPPDY
jgi:DNA mismatch endonuclease (patch repair protein)